VIPYSDERRPVGFAAVVWLIVAANAYVFYLELTALKPAYLINEFALVPYNVTHGIQLSPPSPHPYWLTLITSMFLHGGYLHIFFNMLYLAVFGPRMERYLGHIDFALVYLLSGIAGGLAQIWADPNSHVPEIGASGAIAGILGAYIVTYPASRIDTVTPIGCFPLFLRLPALLVIGIWAATQFFLGFETFDPRANQGGVAYFAHIGGFSCGAILVGLYGLFAGRNPLEPPRNRR
jgi:membrane associated rhomboid family serine protease